MTAFRAGFLVLFLAGAAYANSLGNGFAYDDNSILPQNPLVTAGDWRGALSSPYQPDALEGAGLYRPVTSLSFTLEWMAFGEDPLGYHLLNLLFHALVSLLVFLLLLEMGAVFPALVGGVLFAVHPLHSEAVANVVGRAELYSAFFFLGACLLYWRGGDWEGWRRVPRLMGLGFLYFLSLGAKEIGVTLPIALLLLELSRPFLVARPKSAGGSGPGVARPGVTGRSLTSRLLREAPTYLLFLAVLLAFLGLRWMVLGSLTGEVSAPIFRALGPGERILTAVALWVQYARLLLFPLDLAADYAPGVLFPAEGMELGVVLGAGVILGFGYFAVRALRAKISMPLVTLGILWFVLVVLPVSNLLFPTGVLLAERTLYLPSVGLSFAAAGVTSRFLGRGQLVRRLALALSVGVLFVLFVRTVLRNPSWFNTYTVLETLNREHPESHLAFLNRGSGLDRVGDSRAAGDEFSMALRLAPQRYGTLTEVAEFYGRMGQWADAEALLRRAIEVAPSRDDAYRLLSTQLLRQQRGRDAHGVALAGLANADPHPDLWGAVSESYLLKGDLEAALRARRVALGMDSTSAGGWARLADILEALGEREGATAARGRALALQEKVGSAGPPSPGRPEGPADSVRTDGGSTL
ncbi:MAG: hypothetical protein ABIF09_14285 [Gemmatimonadota bacterium]